MNSRYRDFERLCAILFIGAGILTLGWSVAASSDLGIVKDRLIEGGRDTDSAGWSQSRELYLVAGEPTVFHVTTPYRQGDKGQLVAWRFEKGGPETATVKVEWGSGRNERTIVWRPATHEEMLYKTAFGVAQYTVTSETDQIMKIGVRSIFGFNDTVRPEILESMHGYNDAMCSPFDCGPEIDLPSDRYVLTDADAEQYIATRQLLGIIGLIAGIIAAIGYKRLLQLYVALFPSRTAQRVRAGESTEGSYRTPSANPVKRSADIAELETLVDQAKATQAQLSAEEEAQKKQDEEKADLTRKLKDAIQDVKDIQAQIKKTEGKHGN